MIIEAIGRLPVRQHSTDAGADPAPESDAVKPDYYQFGDVNAREIIQHLSHFGGAAVKYIIRASRIDGVVKGQTVEDIDKAIECLQVERARLEAAKPRAEIVRDK